MFFDRWTVLIIICVKLYTMYTVNVVNFMSQLQYTKPLPLSGDIYYSKYIIKKLKQNKKNINICDELKKNEHQFVSNVFRFWDALFHEFLWFFFGSCVRVLISIYFFNRKSNSILKLVREIIANFQFISTLMFFL